MSNRLTILELAGLLAESTGKTNEDIEQFLNIFVAVVSESIFADRLVQIKGIGNFKIIQVEKRESVDVNTRERIVIPEHYKLSFTPDKDMREIVNKPFAFFESIEISNEADFISMKNIPEEKDKEDRDELEEEDTEIETGIGTGENNIQADTVSLPVTEEIRQDSPPPPPPPPEEKPSEEKKETEGEVHEETETAETKERHVEYKNYSDMTTLEQEEIKETIKTNQQFNDNNMIDDSRNRMGGYDSRPGSSNTVVVLLLVLVVILVISLVSVLVFNKDALFGGNKTLAETTLPDVSPDFALPPDDTTFEDEWENEISDSFDEVVEVPPVVTTAPAATPPPAHPRATGLAQRKTVVVGHGDRLNLFALKYYGNKVFWVYIYQYNQSKLSNPDNIPVGIELVIPAASEYQIDANNQASVRKASMLQTQILRQYAASSRSGDRSSYQGNYSLGNPYQYPSYSQDTYNSGSYGSQNGGTGQYGTDSYGTTGQYGTYPPYDNNTQNTYSDPYSTSGNSEYEYGSSLYDNSLNNNNNTIPPYNNDNTQYNNSQYSTNPNR